MLTSGLKCELEALADKDFQYLTKEISSTETEREDWLD